MIEKTLIEKGKLTDDHIDEIIRRHKKRDISFYSESWNRHAKIRWRLYNCQFWKRKKYE